MHTNPDIAEGHTPRRQSGKGLQYPVRGSGTLTGRADAPGVVTVNDMMQQGYSYELTAPVGRDFHSEFAANY